MRIEVDRLERERIAGAIDVQREGDGVIGAALLAGVLGAIDGRMASDRPELFFAFGGSPEGARSVLSTIAESMLTFTGLVFTITMLVLQLASSQLSPRVMRTFLRDRGNQVVLGIFVATFVFTLLVLRDVRTPVDGGAGYVPAISVWVAFGLLLASVGAFVWHIDHMAHAIRANTVIANIWRETIDAIDRLYPEEMGRDSSEAEWSPSNLTGLVLKSPQAGVVIGIDEAKLLDSTAEDGVVEIVPRVGDFVAHVALDGEAPSRERAVEVGAATTAQPCGSWRRGCGIDPSHDGDRSGPRVVPRGCLRGCLDARTSGGNEPFYRPGGPQPAGAGNGSPPHLPMKNVYP